MGARSFPGPESTLFGLGPTPARQSACTCARARASFELARIRRLAGLDDDRTTELATSARAMWRANDGDKEAAEIEAWLLERGR